jgi:ParB family chromosome partitioning protein
MTMLLLRLSASAGDPAADHDAHHHHHDHRHGGDHSDNNHHDHHYDYDRDDDHHAVPVFDQRSPSRFQSDAAWAARAQSTAGPLRGSVLAVSPLRVTARLSAQPASAASENDYKEWSGCIRRHEESVPLSPEDEEKLDALCDEYDRMQDAHPDPDEETEARLSELSDEIDALRERDTLWLLETLAVAGAVVCIDEDGEIDVRRGLASPAAAADVASAGHGLPYSLVESLTTHRTAALGAALSQNPQVALSAVVHALALKAFYGYRGDSCVEIFSKLASLRLAEGSTARALLETASENWRTQLPDDPDLLWTWCMDQSQERLRDLLAFCAASSVNAMPGKSDRADGDRFAHAHALAQALDLDMAAWFTPTAGNFFGRLTKTGIVDVLREAKGNAIAPAWLKAKKSDLASIAEREVAGTGWLPAPLRRAA